MITNDKGLSTNTNYNHVGMKMSLKCPYCPRRFDGLDAVRAHVAGHDGAEGR